MHREYGPIVRVGPTELSVADVAAFKTIHRAGLAGFPKAPWYWGQTDYPVKAVFNMSDNHEHAIRRRMLAPGFTRTNVVREWEPVLLEKTRLLVKQMQGDAARHGGKVDVVKWFLFYAADVSATVMFGESFEMLERGEVGRSHML